MHNRAELLRELADNLTDLAVMVRPPNDMDTVNEAFAPHPYVIVAPSMHPLARQKRIPIAALARECFIVREKGSDTWIAMAESFARWLPKLTIGMTITMDILMGGPLTGAAMNPARWFGPAIVSGFFENGYVYWIGPLLGGSIAAFVYRYLYLEK